MLHVLATDTADSSHTCCFQTRPKKWCGCLSAKVRLGYEIRTYHISIVHTCTGVKAYAVPVVEFRSGRTYIAVVVVVAEVV